MLRVRTLILGSCLTAAALGSCITPATEVLVQLDTDAPLGRTLTIRVQVAEVGHPAQRMHLFTRGGALGDTNLPGSFAVVTGAGEDLTQPLTLTIEAELAAGANGESSVTFRRIARFTFTPHVSTTIPIFLAISCGSMTTGCTNAAVACTLSERCEEMNMTCGDRGACVSQIVMPTPFDAGARTDANDVARDAASDTGAVDAPADVANDAIDQDVVVPANGWSIRGGGFETTSPPGSQGGAFTLRSHGFVGHDRVCAGTTCVTGGLVR